MKRLLAITLAALSLLGTASCVVSPLSQGEAGEGTEGVAVDMLAGTWSLPCTADSVGSYFTESWMFDTGRFVQTQKSYAVSDCASVPATAESYEGTYEVGGPVFTPSGYYCVEVDFAYDLFGVRYDIFRQAGGFLYFGDTATGSRLTALERPTEIDFDMAYEKQ